VRAAAEPATVMPSADVAAIAPPATFSVTVIALLAGESASFLQAFTKIGLVPDCGSTWFLPRMVGDVRARAMIMLAEKIPARDALQYGLVWKVHPDDQLQAEAAACAEKLATMPTRAYDLVKQALAHGASAGLADQLEVEALMQGQASRTEDFREGVAAFVEKRPARFSGR
jgi:2-(1,2-epoxy-1,2-dihydrophenyl)acetyl-CoA isomerase